MNGSELDKCVELIKGLYPNAEITPQEWAGFSTAIRRYPFALADRAIQEHWSMYAGRPKFPALFMLCRVLSEKENRTKANNEPETLVAIFRKQIKAAGMDCQAWSDARVIASWHRSIWWQNGGPKRLNDGDREAPGQLERIKRECARDLLSANVLTGPLERQQRDADEVAGVIALPTNQWRDKAMMLDAAEADV